MANEQGSSILIHVIRRIHKRDSHLTRSLSKISIAKSFHNYQDCTIRHSPQHALATFTCYCMLKHALSLKYFPPVLRLIWLTS